MCEWVCAHACVFLHMHKHGVYKVAAHPLFTGTCVCASTFEHMGVPLALYRLLLEQVGI